MYNGRHRWLAAELVPDLARPWFASRRSLLRGSDADLATAWLLALTAGHAAEKASPEP